MIEFIFGIGAGIALSKKVDAIKNYKLPKLPSSVKIVRFSDEKYAVRRGWIDYEYLSMTERYWWSPRYKTEYCLGTRSQAEAQLLEYTRTPEYGEPV